MGHWEYSNNSQIFYSTYCLLRDIIDKEVGHALVSLVAAALLFNCLLQFELHEVFFD
jgi:hypothetical protein